MSKIAPSTSRKAESEKTLEARLVSEVKKRDGLAIKLTSQFHRGMPDRLLLLPFHTIVFVEMKSTGKKPTALQESAMDQLRSMRFTCRVVDSTEELDELLSMLDARLEEQRSFQDVVREKRREISKAMVKERQAELLEEKIKRHESVRLLEKKFDNDYRG